MNDSNWLVLEDSSLDAGPGEIVEYGRVVVISPASWTAERVLFEKTPSFRTLPQMLVSYLLSNLPFDLLLTINA